MLEFAADSLHLLLEQVGGNCVLTVQVKKLLPFPEENRLAEYNGLLTGIDLDAFGLYDAATRGEIAQILWNLRIKQ